MTAGLPRHLAHLINVTRTATDTFRNRAEAIAADLNDAIRSDVGAYRRPASPPSRRRPDPPPAPARTAGQVNAYGGVCFACGTFRPAGAGQVLLIDRAWRIVCGLGAADCRGKR